MSNASNGASQGNGANPQARPAVSMSPQAARHLATLLDKERKAKKEREDAEALRNELGPIAEARNLVKQGKVADALRLLGVDPSEGQKALASSLDPNEALREELRALRAEVSQLRDREENFGRDSALRDAETQVAEYVRGSGKYDLVRATGSEALVFQTILAHYEKTGEVLTEDRAAEHVESQLSAQVDKVLAVPSVRSRLQGGQATGDQATAEPTATLSQEDSTATPTRTDRSGPMSLEDAARYIEWVEPDKTV